MEIISKSSVMCVNFTIKGTAEEAGVKFTTSPSNLLPHYLAKIDVGLYYDIMQRCDKVIKIKDGAKSLSYGECLPLRARVLTQYVFMCLCELIHSMCSNYPPCNMDRPILLCALWTQQRSSGVCYKRKARGGGIKRWCCLTSVWRVHRA